ncbi:MAG: hypothetical protein JNL38_00085 [Myxococcales bacterium]|nr:hypothetical protein [Myxococcales bacterium]
MSARAPEPPRGDPSEPRSAGAPDESGPRSTLADAMVPLAPRGNRPAPLVFRQGAHAPYGIRWYGVTSLYGHLRNFVSRAIATQSVDSRDWMRANDPSELLAATLRVLHGDPTQPSLVEGLGRPVYIDFVADTGDDRDVSAAVGEMVASRFDVDGRELPRGEILLFGGDVAYPVATADEIYKRVILPWNDSLRAARSSQTRRVLLGVPGNHDWYDGLDGFGRMFRRRVDEPFRADAREGRTTRLVRRLARRRGRKLGLVARGLHLDEVGGILGAIPRVFRGVKAFVTGVGVHRRRRLVLKGYEPVQEASYFGLRLAPGLELWGADRQLGRVDFRQRTYFKSMRADAPDAGVLFVAGDPALTYGVDNEPGSRMLSACKLDFEEDDVFYLCGDFHHYERRKTGPGSIHVIAGGGGAFLHGTRMSPYPEPAGPPDCVYPQGFMSRRLAAQVPLKLMLGRAGFIVHWAMALLGSIEVAASGGRASLAASAAFVSLLFWIILNVVCHQGTEKKKTALLALPFSLVLGFMPMALRSALPNVVPTLASDTAVLVVFAFLGSLVFGLFLSTAAVLGYEHQQAFTVLGHPGFKHFVRMCVHPTGRVEAWVIGKDDALAPGLPELIDHFEWQPRKGDRASADVAENI